MDVDELIEDPEFQELWMKLTPYEREVALNYVETGSYAESIMRCEHYKPKDRKSAGNMGYQILRRPHVRSAMIYLFKDKLISAEEVMLRIQELATFQVSDVVKPTGRSGFTFDFKRAAETGSINLIRSISKGRNGVKVEFPDRMSALVTLGKFHKMLVERVDVTSNGNTIQAVPDDQYTRSISALADALRKAVLGEGGDQDSPVVPSEPPSVGRDSEQGG